MLSLATAALDGILDGQGEMKTVVLGFGEMGCKAVEALWEAQQSDILVVSRDPSVSYERNPDLASKCTMISYDDWNTTPRSVDLVISTIRNADPTYHAWATPFPSIGEATLMDFSWPPSIHSSGIRDNQVLLGMEHWIKASHNLRKRMEL